MSERRVKWAGLDKCIWLHLPWADRACRERYGMCENPPCLLHAWAPTAAHQPLQEPENFPCLVGHRAGLGQCKHLMWPSGSSKCSVTHTLKRPEGNLLWNWFAAALAPGTKTTHVVSGPPLAALFNSCKLPGMPRVWNPVQGLAVFCKASLCPKQIWVFFRINSSQQTLATEKGLSHLERTHLGIALGSPTVMLYSSNRAVPNFHTGLVSKCYTSCAHWQDELHSPINLRHSGALHGLGTTLVTTAPNQSGNTFVQWYQSTCAVCTAWFFWMTTNFKFSESSLLWLLEQKHLLTKKKEQKTLVTNAIGESFCLVATRGSWNFFFPRL